MGGAGMGEAVPVVSVLIQADARALPLPDDYVQAVVTSPPYWGLRNYGSNGQIGLEATPEAYVDHIVAAFREIHRVLRTDGVVWLNLGDTYATGGGAVGRAPGGGDQGARFIRAGMINTQPNRMKLPGLKSKELIGIPWRVAFALQADGWYLRQDIIWHKPNPMPESVTDRCTKAHEYLFLLTKSEQYYWNKAAMQEPATGRDPGNRSHKYVTAYEQSSTEEHRTKANLVAVGPRETRNKRSVWTVSPHPYKGAHFATFPPELIRPCVRAGCPAGGLVLDPFGGSGTTAQVCLEEGRGAVLLELNPEYAPLIRERVDRTLAKLDAKKVRPAIPLPEDNQLHFAFN